MVIIVITVVTQGLSVPAKDWGKLSLPLLTVNGGVFQAIGVISFGTPPLVSSVNPTDLLLYTAFVCRESEIQRALGNN